MVIHFRVAMTYDHTLAGGHPVLDFVNSIDDWTVPAANDYLREFGDAVRFASAVGLITRREAQTLTDVRGRSGAAELDALRRLRASLEGVLRAWLAGRRAPASDLGVLQDNLAETIGGTRLAPAGDRPLAREIPAASNGPAVVRFRIVERAIALLASDQVARVKACPACGWFFLDVSKNHSRVWCRMDTCGAREKARRYYRRTRRRSSSRTRPARSQP
jgi:predicted RNA-binding Zn ribbon-like protein